MLRLLIFFKQWLYRFGPISFGRHNKISNMNLQ
jgi:hypothetical protein